MKKVRKIYTLLLFLLFHSFFCQSQQPVTNGDDRVEVIKMAYMSRELSLSPQEAQNFWPVYNNYVNEIKQARNQFPNDEVAFEKKVVQIKEHYQGNFKKVLGNGDRVNKVYTTDRQFKNMLRTEQQNRQLKQEQNYQQQKLQQKNNIQPNNNINNGSTKNNIKRGNVKKTRPPH